MHAWLLLTLAVAAEVLGIYFHRLSNGYEHLLPTFLMIVFYSLAIWGFGFVVKNLGISMSYAIWSGASIALSSLMGVVLFTEQVSVAKLTGLVSIIVGVIILHSSADNA